MEKINIQKLKPTKQSVLKFIKDFCLVVFGTLILAIGTELFIIPAGLVTGGVSGIAIAISYVNETVNTELLITIISWALFFIGFIFLGKRFAIQTLTSTIFYPIFLFLLNHIVKYAPFLLIENSVSISESLPAIQILSALFGGIFVGTGCAVTFMGGGSTGGVDVITFILCKYLRWIKSSISIFVVDALIVVIGFILNKNHDLALCLEGVTSAFIAALVIDKIFVGTSKTFVAYIVTDKYEEVSDKIIHQVDRTTSIFDIEGGYSKEKKKMVMVSFTMGQYSRIMGIVSATDRRAFMTIHRAHEINGEGFKPLQ